MNKEIIIKGVQSILINKFGIPPTLFQWHLNLQLLNKSFIFLGTLQDLEEELSTYFDRYIPLIENIETSLHSPNDIVLLILDLYIDDNSEK